MDRGKIQKTPGQGRGMEQHEEKGEGAVVPEFRSILGHTIALFAGEGVTMVSIVQSGHTKRYVHTPIVEKTLSRTPGSPVALPPPPLEVSWPTQEKSLQQLEARLVESDCL